MSEEKIDLSKIKLTYKDTPGTGKEIFAFIGQKFNCVEFTMRDDVPQPITYHPDPKRPIPIYICSARWIQFPPETWNNTIEAIFTELVSLWNEKYTPDNEPE